MDIKLSHSLLSNYLKTATTPSEIAEKLSLCGPTVDRMETVNDDVVYDIEIITNRVDAASAFGVAREAAAILPQFGLKAQLINNPYNKTLTDLGPLPNNQPVTVTITDPTLVPRFTCIAITNVSVKPSSSTTKHILEVAGERSLNNIIDISNELTLKYGQPVHIFDLDRIVNQTMIVRESRPKEEIQTLDGKTHVLPGGDIVIEDGGGRLIDLCGIMGGSLSAVTETTKNVLLFVQTYEPKHIRKTSLATQERTLASQLFEKQPDSEMVMPVLVEGAQLILERAGGKIGSTILDIYPHPLSPLTLDLDLNWLSSFAGVTIPQTQIVDILNQLGFTTNVSGDSQLICTVPSWRLHDIVLKEDLAEEIVRVYGYFRLPSILPTTAISPIGTDPKLIAESKTRVFMAQLGFTEVYSNSLISLDQVKLIGANEQELFKLNNPLSEEFMYMRPSLIPSIIQTVLANRSTVTPPIRVFELSNTYHQKENDQLAHEWPTLAFATVGEDFRTAKGLLKAVISSFNLKLELQGIKANKPPFSSTKAGKVIVNGQEIGWMGYVGHTVVRSLHLPHDVILAEINLERVLNMGSFIHHFQPVSPYAPIIEDLTFTFPIATAIGPVMDMIKTIDPLIMKVDLKTIFNQNYTFTITYQSLETNLSTETIAPIRQHIITAIKSKYSGALVGQL